MSPGKKYVTDSKKVNPDQLYNLDEALDILLSFQQRKFDQTAELAIRLGIDPKQGDQQIRGAISLPHGLGKKVRVLVFAKGEKQKEAESAGADFFGADDLVEKIQGGWLDFDVVVATPDMMGVVGKLGKVLGPKGLMPNPKVGTVTFDVAKAVTECKAGKVEYRAEKAGIVHVAIGKVSFGKEKLKGNILALVDAVYRAKPASAKGTYLKSISLSATMSPGIKLNTADLIKVA